jgi:hypothetical protein
MPVLVSASRSDRVTLTHGSRPKFVELGRATRAHRSGSASVPTAVIVVPLLPDRRASERAIRDQRSYTTTFPLGASQPRTISRTFPERFSP